MIAAALSAVASERDAAAIRAFGQRVWSDTEEVAYQAGVNDTRARLQVPLAAQIDAVHDEVEKWKDFASAHPKLTPGERDLAARELEMWRGVLASLSALTKIAEMLK